MIIVEGISFVTLAVSDLSASVQFFSDIFDFEIVDDSHKGYIVMTLDPIKVKLVKVDKVENQLGKLNIPSISFEMDVDDFTEAITELEDKGITIVKGPEAMDNGESLVFKDPDNNLVEIFYQS